MLVKSWLNRFLIWCHLRRPIIALPELDSPPILPPAAPAAPVARKPRVAPGVDGSGDFFFREDILDQLGSYAPVIRHLRKHDPNSYELYREVGAVLFPMRSWAHKQEIEPFFLKVRPSFGATFFGVEGDKDPERIWPRMMYFKKWAKPPASVQRVNRGSLYCVCVFFADLDTGKAAHVAEVPVAVADDGTVTILRTKLSERQVVRCRKNGGLYHRGERFGVTHERWGIHPLLVRWATFNNEPVVPYLTNMFALAANFWASAQMSMIRVEASKGAEIAVFGVDITRTPYFFKDREKIAGRRIFHIVRTHQREGRDGRVSSVKTHFRGLRHFMWNGFKIKITVPGWHHGPITEFSPGMHDEEKMKPGMATLGEVGKFLHDYTLH